MQGCALLLAIAFLWRITAARFAGAGETCSVLGSECASIAMASSGARKIVRKVLSVEQAEGQGARVRRSIGRPEVRAVLSHWILAEAREICLYD